MDRSDIMVAVPSIGELSSFEVDCKKSEFPRSCTASTQDAQTCLGSDAEDGTPSLSSRSSEDGAEHEAGRKSNGQRFASLTRNGPEASAGSKGHPDLCTPCAFYCFSLCGCRSGPDCSYCHMFHESRVQQRRQEWKRKRQERRVKGKAAAQARASSKEDISMLEFEEDAMEAMAGVIDDLPMTSMPLKTVLAAMSADPQDRKCMLPTQPRLPPGLHDVEQLAPLVLDTYTPTPPSMGANPLKVVPFSTGLPDGTLPFRPECGSGSLFDDLLFGSVAPAPAPLTADDEVEPCVFSYSPGCLTLRTGQAVELAPQEALKGLFAVLPALPKGLYINPMTGLIAGTPLEATKGLISYFVSCSSAAGQPIGIAMLKLQVLSTPLGRCDGLAACQVW
mmetsp:Transcript_51076/g.94479  ORF Transcript_51076/g.94479 Transcript_51076/m.94479 type:complete len:391 (+) Transcript_51076:150-1322(+)